MKHVKRIPQWAIECPAPEVDVLPCGCWHMKTRPKVDGYSRVNFRHEGRAIEFSGHRYFFARHNGVDALEPDLTLDHLCRNRRCVNPEHLEQVTQWENTRRGVSKIANLARQTHCKRGHLLSGDNLRILVNGGRRCRSCSRLLGRDYDRHRRRRSLALAR